MTSRRGVTTVLSRGLDFTRGVTADVLITLKSAESPKEEASAPNLEKYAQSLAIGKKNLKALADGTVASGTPRE